MGADLDLFTLREGHRLKVLEIKWREVREEATGEWRNFKISLG
jgi:hypothetical protein